MSRMGRDNRIAEFESGTDFASTQMRLNRPFEKFSRGHLPSSDTQYSGGFEIRQASTGICGGAGIDGRCVWGSLDFGSCTQARAQRT